MALAFDPIRTFFRGIKQVQTNTYPFIEKERVKGKALGMTPLVIVKGGVGLGKSMCDTSFLQ